MNIHNIDLNLLGLFHVLNEEKSVSKAALRLGLSQPAVSNALSRLRGILGDPLFVRGSKGLQRTPRALELEKPIDDFIHSIENILLEPKVFDARSSRATFRLATTDYFEQVFLPKLLKYMEREAPQMTLVSRPTLGKLPKDELESGSYDLAIAGFYGDLPEGYFQQIIFQDDFVCVAGKKHPVHKSKLTLEAYSKYQHLMISPQGDLQGRVDELLKKKNLRRQIRAGVSSFTSTGWALCDTDLLLTCPRKLAQRFTEYLPLAIQEPPFDLPALKIYQVWHQRTHVSPSHQWLRQAMARISKDI